MAMLQLSGFHCMISMVVMIARMLVPVLIANPGPPSTQGLLVT